ncbi:GNAT family N-acetyltransferase [Kineosporia babensis]|uniref:GNAT family N-acetyltransferase n=1 Tax=Kineosporia babensis TaxID=499548 RepID=A0A9X1NKE5_9ACTN|nr:GNAT family N-acetyltransferase [Kineosporia babensis]
MSSYTPPVDERPDDTPWPALKWPIADAVVLSGGSVTLTKFTAADAHELFAALDHEAVWAHVPGRPASAEQFGASIAERVTERGDTAWVVRLSEAVGGLAAGAVVGTTSYLDVVVGAARLEIGWTMYTPAVWGGRVNPSAKFLLLRHAFEELGAGRVQLKTDIRNHRSQRAIARLGARPEGVLRRYQPRADGTMRDSVLFSVIAEEWPAVSSGLQERLNP